MVDRQLGGVKDIAAVDTPAVIAGEYILALHLTGSAIPFQIQERAESKKVDLTDIPIA